MTLPERFPPDDPREWINRARRDLAMAKNRIAGAYLEGHCFHAQQAAEKAVNSVMILRGIDFPYIHDLSRLLFMLESFGEKRTEQVRQADALTEYAGVFRYPVYDEPVSEQAYKDAVTIAEAVVVWAEDRIGYSAIGSGP